MMGPSRCRFSLYGVVYATLFFTIDAYLNPQILGPSEQPEAYFNGSSYLRLQTPISLRRLVGLSFRTCTGGDLFSQQHSENIIQLSVNSEGVVFFAKTARQQHIEEKIKGNFVDNKWHTVSFHYRLGNLTIYVDKHVKLLANSTFRRTLLSPGLYNEGAVLIVGNHYIGCMLEGPSIVFNESLIQNHNVQFRSCPIADDDCLPSHDHYVPGAPRRNPLPPTTDYCINEPCMRHGKCINTETTYTCECTARYTGKNCEIDQGSPCARDPCLNDARCVEDADGDYRCVCRAGYTGAICEREINLHPLCVGVACHNGGSCQVSGGQVECVCADGYTGAMCETEVDECVGYPCKHSGVCIDGVNNYTCDCTGTGYTGRNCEVNVNECLKTPCLNRGVCFDTYGGYLCQCLAGFDGVNCELNVNECMSQPCLNNGLCVNDVSGYRCKCPQGFTGFHCEIEPRQQQQQQQPLPPVTTCDDCPPYTDCTEDLQCICKPEHPGEYPNCSGIGQCPVNPCKNGGKCFQWNGGINCTCPKGFTGAQCQINENDCASRPCLNDGVCIDKVNGFYCNCTEQWMGTICETPYDACKFKPCQNNATCVTGTNKHEFVCNCPPGFAGDRCQMNLDDCVGVTCPPGKVCVDLVSRYECRCPPGYSGDNCTVDTDACLRKPCENGATCTTDPITLDFQCICPTGWQGETCDEDVNECDQPGIPICNQGVCMNRNGSFQCYCLPGYTGERCNLDFDECLSQPCKHNATCVNKVNNYECVCPPGFAGKDCHIDINECEPMPCTAGSTCIDGINEFTCLCQPGLTGKLCSVNIDDCMSSPCLNGAQCIDGLNSYYCNCTDTGYTGSHCEINIDECSSSPCVNGAECIDDVKDYRCNCYPGYTGRNCEEDINECESDPCKYSGTCLEKSNLTLYHIGGVSDVDVTLPDVFRKDFDYSEAAGYECLCIPGITGKNCEIDINECDSSPCLSGFCKDAVGGYTCECDNGYEGAHCEIDIDECEKYTPCVHGTCYDGRANYECHCDALYGGKNCSVELIGCKDDPCLNNGVCKPYLVRENDHRFNCSCPNGFHGDTCEGVTTMSLSGRSSVTVNTTREEGYDIQFRFKTTLGDGILALGRGVTYYILELSRGRLNLHTSLLNKWEGVFIGSNLHDSKWQKVFVAINSSHLVLSANDEQTIYPITFNENFNVSSTSFPTTYIGGIPSNVNLRKLTHGQPFLVGCAEDVLINGEWVLPETRNASWLEFQDVEVGCHRIPQCNPNPCHSGGHCTDKWRDFSCTCERPYLGRTCQYNFTAATFGYENITDSLVTVIVADAARRAVRSIVDISMFIRTRQPRGQIFYLGSSTTSSDSTFISAELEAGELLMRVLFNGTTEAYTVGGVKLDNGYNHLIQVIRNVTLVQVKLNGTEYFRKTISATGSLDAQVMYLGGEPQTRSVRQTAENVTPRIDVTPTGPSAAMSSLQNVHFKGIIQDVQISNGSKVMVVEFFPLKIPELNIPMSFGNVSFDKLLVLEGVRSDNSCRVNPCNHNGKCINTWNDYRCECTRGFKGKDCTEQEFCELERCPPSSECKNLDDGYECVANATFDGKSPPLMYSHTVLNQQIGEQFSFTSLELNYRTRSWGTVLFARYLESYFAIFVYHNQVIVQWHRDGETDHRRFQIDHFDGQWLTIYLEVKDDVLIGGFKDMVLDESPSFEVRDFGSINLTEVFTKGTVYVAGSDNKSFDYWSVIADLNMTSSYFDITTDITLGSNSVELAEHGVNMEFLPPLYKIDVNKTTDNFKGCLGEIRVSNLLLPFFTVKQLYPNNHYSEAFFELLSETQQNVGCILCQQTDCFNNGRCVDPEQTYKCECPKGYTADDCSVDIDECEDNNCKNNATCIDEIGRYQCKCLDGFEGDFCEQEIDECESNPCKNGGTCHDGLAEFTCTCTDDYVGKQCEMLKLITCQNNPCKNGSTCTDGKNDHTGNNFTCACTPGMLGIHCDVPYCVDRPCDNGGVCNATATVPYCRCPVGFEGALCEINTNDCILPTGGSPCANGGACVDGIGTFECVCTGTGYTGQYCETDIDECKVIRSACGRGVCTNTPGAYRCACDDPNMCGYRCSLPDPCRPNPCDNGGSCEANCTDTPDYVCHCTGHFGGKNCTDTDVASEQKGSDFNILYVIVPVVVVLVIAAAIGLAVLVNVARSKRATRGTYSPSAQEFCNPRVELDHVLKPPPEERLI